MELRLVVETRGQPPREIAVEAEPQHLVREVARAVAAHLGASEPLDRLRLYSQRTGRWLDPEVEVQEADLRWGDRLTLAPSLPREAARPDVLVDLVVLSGPSAGLREPLPPGEHRVGSFRYSGTVLDDPTVSRVHLIASVTRFGAVTVQDADSESGTFLDGKRIAGPTPVQPGQVLVLGRSVITFERRDPAPAQDGRAQPARNASGRIAFNRPPRVAQPAPQTEFELEAIPAKKGGFHMPLSTALVPLAMGVVMYLAYRTFYMLLFALLSPAMVIFSLVETAFPNRLSLGRAMRRFRKRLRELDGQMAGAAAAEDAYRRLTAPDPPAVLDRARRLDPSLWERRPDDPDWLTLRVGWADQPSSVTLKLPDSDEGLPALRAEAEQMAARHRLLRSAPMTVSLKEVGVLGLAGDAAQVLAIARWLAVQLAVLHSPEDLVIAAAVPSASRAEWAWLGWLPHLHSETSPVQQPLLVGDRIAARELLDRLLTLVTEREQAVQPGAQAQRFGASVVAFVHEGVELPRGTASVLLERGPAVGVHVIWLSAVAQDLPGACGAVVELLQAGGLPVLTLPASGATLKGGGAEGVSERLAKDMALQLAPVRDVSSRSRQAGIPRRVGFMELLALQEAPESTIMANWVRDRSMPEDRPLSATWGVADGGVPFSVSVRLDGPHALVGGTTGAGKSELLQAFVAALAVAHSPRTLNFLLVDYKGGAAFKDCVDLPHTVGFVTDLDGHLVNRALVSLRAELRRREEILREVGGKDLIDLERRFPDVAPASLLIVVDEFAALVSELPEFVDGMVDVAQRGRSLGIHLVLATQRPAGVIGDKIRANTPLRVSLRFADGADSQDVIGTKDAARPGLPPGRAFALTGGEVTEFQAAYVGGRTSASSSGPAAVQVRDLGFGGVVLAAPERRAERREPETGQTDLQRLVAAINVVNRRLALQPPFRPWLPTLPEVLPLDSLPAAQAGGLRAVLGAIDDPAGQRQLPLDFDLSGEGNLLVYGASGSGKTTALRTLACSLALGNGPDRLHIYALDFATRGLRPLEALPHCGAVITEDQMERAVRLLGMLRAETERRKGLFATVGAATLAEYRAVRPAEPVPSILCLLDGYSSFAPAFETIDGGDWLLVLRALVSEGRPLGIAFAIANDRQAPQFTAISNSITRRLILRLASEDEYALWGLPHWLVADAHLPPGRGFTERALEAHVACIGSDPSGSGQAAAVAELGARLRAQTGAAAVPEIRTLPTEISRASLPPPRAPLEAVVGIADRDLQPLRLDLGDGHFVVTGPRRSGRTTALAAIAASLAAGPRPAVDLHLLCPRRNSPLVALGVWTNVALGEDACTELAGRLAGEARADETGQASRAAVLVVDDGDELLQGGPSMDLEWIAQRGVEHGLHIVTAVDAQSIQRAFGTWLPVALRDRQGLMLDPDVLDGQNFGVRLPHRTGAFPAGRGYLVRRGEFELVQIAGD